MGRGQLSKFSHFFFLHYCHLTFISSFEVENIHLSSRETNKKSPLACEGTPNGAESEFGGEKSENKSFDIWGEHVGNKDGCGSRFICDGGGGAGKVNRLQSPPNKTSSDSESCCFAFTSWSRIRLWIMTFSLLIACPTFLFYIEWHFHYSDVGIKIFDTDDMTGMIIFLLYTQWHQTE